ncbi:hypothetical protein J2Z47_005135 [Cohnella thailandensis]|nr:hypothetical protein [Cohnella thailandensis]
MVPRRGIISRISLRHDKIPKGSHSYNAGFIPRDDRSVKPKVTPPVSLRTP